ncbi:virion core protein [Pteropox virus]|uniref:Virion core protein n=1 Tax=Pteropox virus TaxID=1873698 RepID=A0A1B1MRF9_9POXV|nr:virion core protein [Pteropox virus]ANS71168.1 virion core protein [Pteropox virus]
MDIYTVKDNLYPDSISNKCYVLLGNHDIFIKKSLNSLSDIVMFSKFEISARSPCDFLANIVHSSAVLNNRFLSPVEFLEASCPAFCSNVSVDDLEKHISCNNTTISVYVTVFKDVYKNWKSVVFVQCPSEISVPNNITINNIKISNLDIILSNPYLAFTSSLDSDTNQRLFNNLVLRASVNEMIIYNNKSKLVSFLKKIIPNSFDVNFIALVNESDTSNVKLALLNNNSNALKAFTHAWFSGQLSANDEENIKITNTYKSVITLF